VTNERQSTATPTALEALWERPVPATRKASSDEVGNEIATVALTIADREGLAGLSVKRVAAKIGMPITQLAGYLTTKEDLLDLIFDAFYAEIEPPLAETAGPDTWRADLSAIAASTKAAL
jgi:AcrR family transcriptional regulator